VVREVLTRTVTTCAGRGAADAVGAVAGVVAPPDAADVPTSTIPVRHAATTARTLMAPPLCPCRLLRGSCSPPGAPTGSIARSAGRVGGIPEEASMGFSQAF
jgi:hypothetical protein